MRLINVAVLPWFVFASMGLSRAKFSEIYKSSLYCWIAPANFSLIVVVVSSGHRLGWKKARETFFPFGVAQFRQTVVAPTWESLGGNNADVVRANSGRNRTNPNKNRTNPNKNRTNSNKNRTNSNKNRTNSGRNRRKGFLVDDSHWRSGQSHPPKEWKSRVRIPPVLIGCMWKNKCL
jgi:hypothetical protein